MSIVDEAVQNGVGAGTRMWRSLLTVPLRCRVSRAASVSARLRDLSGQVFGPRSPAPAPERCHIDDIAGQSRHRTVGAKMEAFLTLEKALRSRRANSRSSTSMNYQPTTSSSVRAAEPPAIGCARGADTARSATPR
jgi:hypothetical protein